MRWCCGGSGAGAADAAAIGPAGPGQRGQLHALHAVPAGGRGGDAGAAPCGDAAAEILGRTYLRLGLIVGHNPETRTVELRTKYGQVEQLRYDHLLLSVG